MVFKIRNIMWKSIKVKFVAISFYFPQVTSINFLNVSFQRSFQIQVTHTYTPTDLHILLYAFYYINATDPLFFASSLSAVCLFNIDL